MDILHDISDISLSGVKILLWECRFIQSHRKNKWKQFGFSSRWNRKWCQVMSEALTNHFFSVQRFSHLDINSLKRTEENLSFILLISGFNPLQYRSFVIWQVSGFDFSSSILIRFFHQFVQRFCERNQNSSLGSDPEEVWWKQTLLRGEMSDMNSPSQLNPNNNNNTKKRL